MEEDLRLDSKSYAWLLTIFYISYTVFEVFGLMWKVVKPHQWAAFTIFSWYGFLAQRGLGRTRRAGAMADELQGVGRDVSSRNNELARHDGTSLPNGCI